MGSYSERTDMFAFLREEWDAEILEALRDYAEIQAEKDRYGPGELWCGDDSQTSDEVHDCEAEQLLKKLCDWDAKRSTEERKAKARYRQGKAHRRQVQAQRDQIRSKGEEKRANKCQRPRPLLPPRRRRR